MDADQFQQFMAKQNELVTKLVAGLQQRAVPASNISSVVPPPPALCLDGDMEENYEFFLTNWRNYSQAVGMDSWPANQASKKVSFLMSVIGEAALKKYYNFDLTEDQKKDVAEALKAIKQKVVRSRNLFVDRLDFFAASQVSSESIDDFAARLKSLAKPCKFALLEDEFILFKIVTSNKWGHLRTKMLSMQDLTTGKAVDICRVEEIAEQRLRHLSLESPVVSDVKKINKKTKKKLQRCKFCGDEHEFVKGACPAYGKKCKRCGGRNHFEKACKIDQPWKQKRRHRRVKEVKDDESSSEERSESSSVDSDDEESEHEVQIAKIKSKSAVESSALAVLDFRLGRKWKPVTCEIDTGADATLIGYNCLTELLETPNPTLQPTSIKLKSFGGNPIPVLGQVMLPVKRKGKRFQLVLQVVDYDHRPLLSLKASQSLGFVKFCRSVKIRRPEAATEEEKLLSVYKVKAEAIVEKHSDIFAGYGRFPGVVSLEVDESVQPSIQHPRRVPIALRPKLKQELDKLEEDGIIVKETRHTEWVSNIVLVRRGGQNEFVRICLDPVPLNKALKRPNLQFDTIDELLPELGNAKIFTTVDTKKGFWHVELDTPSSKLTTFWTPFGRYRWVRMPFGISPAPELFQLKLQGAIQGLEGVTGLADDLLVYGTGTGLEEALDNHNRALEQLLVRLKENNVKLNRSKLKLCQTSVKFFGHVLTTKGLTADETKTAAIRNFPTPTNKKELLRFVGMESWRWTAAEDEEFQKVKNLVADIHTLRYYDVTKPLVIECDASGFGLGVAVFQQDGVIGYASRTLTATEKNYAQIEKELLAILFACLRFDQLIVGNPKTVIKTDHKPLVNIFRKPLLSAPRRLQHMLLNLQRYKPEIMFVAGKENVVADAISRAPYDDDHAQAGDYQKLEIFKVMRDLEDVKLKHFLNISDDRLTEIMAETAADPVLQLVIRLIGEGWPETIGGVPDSVRVFFSYRNELTTQDGLVFRNDRILIPHKLRRKMIEKTHISHNGVEATLKLARANIFWPGMSAQIRDTVKECAVCAKFAGSQSKPPMQSHPVPVHPFQLVSLDVFFAEYRGIKRKFLVTVDHYSDLFEIDLLKDLTPQSAIAACKINFARHGVPQLLLTDNGTHFVGKEWRQFAGEWDFSHTTSAPHHQQANGKSEAAVKIAKQLIKKCEESGTDFWYALLHWRNVPNKIGSSPAARLFSRQTRCGVPTAAGNLLPRVVEGVPDAIKENRRKIKYYYDRKCRNLPQLETGAPVYVQVHPQKSTVWSPGTVAAKQTDRSYLVDVDGAFYRRDLVNLKSRKEPNTQPAVNHPVLQDNPLPSGPNPDVAVAEKPAEFPWTDSPSTPITKSSKPNKRLSSLSSTPQPKEKASPTETVTQERSRPKREVKLPTKLHDYCLE
ncbi:uncharacterized protein K02A2.6-like [Culex pipiens pallens]|uniref:uncharacterized protein K02A2.6-like n=1 Tax=Culex pipiens pallens TaxID=42434 RepID=UPI0022AB2173|nr:uncharacterized protein K02A2.6-like [Culex pipiens pallens]